MNILITGATGYIGSHICESLLQRENTIFAIHRGKSSFEKCFAFREKIVWINQDSVDWKQRLERVKFDVLVHSAWGGVSSPERNNWSIQMKNFEFSRVIFDMAADLGVNKIISLGSQAEYGIFDKKVDETYVPYPVSAYGAIKLLTLYYLLEIVRKKLNIQWYWLRVFSLLGTNENESWLLPQVMNKLLSGEEIELTEGKQAYDYLSMNDFVERLNKVIYSIENLSGIYNICSGRSIEIRKLLISVAEAMNVSLNKLRFGKLPYRDNQNMFTVGSPKKFETAFNIHSLESLDETVSHIVNYYINKNL